MIGTSIVFSLLKEHLSSLTDGDGKTSFAVTSRDRESDLDPKNAKNNAKFWL